MKYLNSTSKLLAVLGSATLLASAAHAQTVTSAGTGNWGTGSTWDSDPSRPGFDDTTVRVFIENDNTVTVDGTTPAINIDSSGEGGTTSLIVGQDGGGPEQLDVSGGSITGNEELKVGNVSDATLNLSGSGSLDFERLGLGNGGQNRSGTFNMTGGSASFDLNLQMLVASQLNYSAGSLEFGSAFLPGQGTFSISEIGGTANPILFGANINPTSTVDLDLSIAASAIPGLSVGDQFVLFDYGGTVVSDFNYGGSPLSDGDVIDVSGTDFTYNTATDLGGGDLAITITAIPEPGVAALGLLALGFFAFRRRG